MKLLHATFLSLLVVSASAQQVVNGPISSALAPADKKCLTGSNSVGAPVIIYDCNHTPNQQWRLARSGITEIRVGDPARGICLDAGGVNPNSRVVTLPCNHSRQQTWNYNSDGSLKLAGSSLCLDVPNFSTANGAPVRIYPCQGSPNQAWRI